jgi:hypothetical protein
VEVYRDIESNSRFEDGSELRVVQEFPRRRAIEKDSAETNFLIERSSSLAADSGSFKARQAKPARREGFARIAVASSSFTSLASGVAVDASSASKPMGASESTWRSMPASSMAAMRPAPRSRSFGWSASSQAGVALP